LHGLDFAPRLRILHCDVKPANVIVDADGRPRVTDFGISRDIASKSDNAGLAGPARRTT
jgi:serine/threonine protein kinase